MGMGLPSLPKCIWTWPLPKAQLLSLTRSTTASPSHRQRDRLRGFLTLASQAMARATLQARASTFRRVLGVPRTTLS